jgi:hypothetical protein
MIFGMERVLRGSWWLRTWLACASCAGGQTGESPGEPLALYTGGDGRCEAPVCRGTKPSAEELGEFGDDFSGSGAIGDYEIFDTVAEAVAGPTFIATGWLVGIEQGRRSYNGELCIPERPEDEASPGACVAWEPGYSSHVNLVIEAESVLRGEVPVPAEQLRLELHWPNNLSIDHLVVSAPLGARVLVLSHWVENARQEAAPLPEAGIDQGFIADNLLAALPYGMALEDAEGFAVRQPFHGEDLALLIDPNGGAVRFDDLVHAVEAALE